MSVVIPRTVDEAGETLPPPEAFFNTQMIAFLQQMWDQPVAVPNRVFIREGALMKVCRKDDQQRYFYLFNDALLYGQMSTGTTKTKLRKQHTLKLFDVVVRPSAEREFGIEIRSTSKSFVVYALDAFDYQDWLLKLQHYTDSLNRDAMFVAPMAPLWVPDEKVTTCQLCNNIRFSLISRKHHCRSCGRCVCGGCSDKTWYMPIISKTPVRVCRECFDLLSSGAQIKSRILPAPGTADAPTVPVSALSALSDSSDDDENDERGRGKKKGSSVRSKHSAKNHDPNQLKNFAAQIDACIDTSSPSTSPKQSGYRRKPFRRHPPPALRDQQIEVGRQRAMTLTDDEDEEREGTPPSPQRRATAPLTGVSRPASREHPQPDGEPLPPDGAYERHAAAGTRARVAGKMRKQGDNTMSVNSHFVALAAATKEVVEAVAVAAEAEAAQTKQTRNLPRVPLPPPELAPLPAPELVRPGPSVFGVAVLVTPAPPETERLHGSPIVNSTSTTSIDSLDALLKGRLSRPFSTASMLSVASMRSTASSVVADWINDMIENDVELSPEEQALLEAVNAHNAQHPGQELPETLLEQFAAIHNAMLDAALAAVSDLREPPRPPSFHLPSHLKIDPQTPPPSVPHTDTTVFRPPRPLPKPPPIEPLPVTPAIPPPSEPRALQTDADQPLSPAVAFFSTDAALKHPAPLDAAITATLTAAMTELAELAGVSSSAGDITAVSAAPVEPAAVSSSSVGITAVSFSSVGITAVSVSSAETATESTQDAATTEDVTEFVETPATAATVPAIPTTPKPTSVTRPPITPRTLPSIAPDGSPVSPRALPAVASDAAATGEPPVQSKSPPTVRRRPATPPPASEPTREPVVLSTSPPPAMMTPPRPLVAQRPSTVAPDQTASPSASPIRPPIARRPSAAALTEPAVLSPTTTEQPAPPMRPSIARRPSAAALTEVPVLSITADSGASVIRPPVTQRPLPTEPSMADTSASASRPPVAQRAPPTEPSIVSPAAEVSPAPSTPSRPPVARRPSAAALTEPPVPSTPPPTRVVVATTQSSEVADEADRPESKSPPPTSTVSPPPRPPVARRPSAAALTEPPVPLSRPPVARRPSAADQTEPPVPPTSPPARPHARGVVADPYEPPVVVPRKPKPMTPRAADVDLPVVSEEIANVVPILPPKPSGRRPLPPPPPPLQSALDDEMHTEM